MERENSILGRLATKLSPRGGGGGGYHMMGTGISSSLFLISPTVVIKEISYSL